MAASETQLGDEPPNSAEQVRNEPKINWRQVAGCLAASSTNFAGGFIMSYSSALIPGLEDPKSDIQASLDKSAWLASIPPLVSPIGAVLGVYVMERVGRLATLHLMIIPICISWIVIATAHSFLALLIGRILSGLLITTGFSAAAVLIAETSLKNYRGALLGTATAFVSLGILCQYTLAALTDWRTNAWISLISPLVPFVLTLIFTAESPVWLRMRGRMEQGQKASLYYYKDPDYTVLPPKVAQTSATSQGDPGKPGGQHDSDQRFLTQIRLLLTISTGYKPLIIVTIVCVFMQLTGIYITLFYAVTFFQEGGSDIDPYISTIMNGVMRLIGTLLSAFLMARYKRRVLMIVSSVGMAITMAASGYSTSLALAERAGVQASILPSWFSVACIILYILASAIGLQSIPWTLPSEAFPQKIRGLAQSVCLALMMILMFAGLQAYPLMNSSMGGAVGVQYFFAGFAILTAIFVWVFWPETHQKTLTEVEEYFEHNTIYVGHKKR